MKVHRSKCLSANHNTSSVFQKPKARQKNSQCCLNKIGNAMRKLFLYTVVASIAISCAKTETTTQLLDGEMVTISASSGVITKTSLDGTSVLWSDNDAIKLFTSEGSGFEMKLVDGEGTTLGTFSGTMTSSAAPFYAFYPSANAESKENATVNYTLPQVQSGASGTFAQATNPAIAMFSTLEDKAVFYNMQGLVQLTLKGTQTISKLKITSLADEMLWGSVAATINTTKTPDQWPQAISGGDNKIFLQFTDGLQLSDSGTKVYFVLPAGTLSQGFKLVAYNQDDIPVDEFFTSADHTVVKGAILPMKEIEIGEYNILDAEESANCYNICKTDTELPFKFCAVKGNSFQAAGATSVCEYWEATSNSGSAFNGGNIGYFLSDIKLDKNCISFNMLGRAGNASIAARKGDDIVWSWHIWITDSLPSSAKMANGTSILDTNLGANGPGTDTNQPMGFLYQWGRKDPFPAPYHVAYSSLMCFQPAGIITNEAKSDATVDYAINNPGTFIDNKSTKWDSTGKSVWAENKTIYDPCPPGYRVPTDTELKNLEYGAWDGVFYRYAENTSGYYFHATSRTYFSSKDVHTTETAKSGYYWTCTHSGGNMAQMATYSNSAAGMVGGLNKSFGCAVRCVAENSR